MRPSAFEYAAPASVGEAVALLEADASAKVLAGGQSLVPIMNLRLAAPTTVVDINGIAALEFLEVTDGALRIGALTRHRTLERDPVVAEAAPLLAEAAGRIGHPQVRNRGTIGGSLAHADPAAELATALLALDAELAVQGPRDRRRMPVAGLLEGVMTTTLDRAEVICEIRVPLRAGRRGVRIDEVTPRPSDFAMAIVAICVDADENGTCERVRVAAGGVGPAPIDISGAFEDLVGLTELDEGALRRVSSRAAAMITPFGDQRATADDRRDLLQVLLVRSLPVAWRRARS